jgi:hypothetical protein
MVFACLVIKARTRTRRLIQCARIVLLDLILASQVLPVQQSVFVMQATHLSKTNAELVIRQIQRDQRQLRVHCLSSKLHNFSQFSWRRRLYVHRVQPTLSPKYTGTFLPKLVDAQVARLTPGLQKAVFQLKHVLACMEMGHTKVFLIPT